ncbi:MAG: hypothetical protein U1E27_05750 [Kiritimatiellia bacterium]|nr:hypothetical protein [Kiritimatiellia bacterium]
MNIIRLSEQLGAEALEVPDPKAEVLSGYTSDLLSDVVANAPEGSVLITIQGHLNTVAVASLTGIRAILLAHNRDAPGDMKAAARRERIALLRSPENQYTLSHRVHRLLVGS